MPASTPSAASPRRSTGTWSSSRVRCAAIAEAEALTAGARDLPGPLPARRCATPSSPGSASSRRARRGHGAGRRDRGRRWPKQTVDDRPLLLRLARRRRRAAPADRPMTARNSPSFARLIAGLRAVPGALDHPYWSDAEPCSMHIDEVEAIWAAIDEARRLGRRSTPRSPRSAGWARRCAQMLEKSDAPGMSGRAMADPDLDRTRHRRDAVDRRGGRCRRRGRRARAPPGRAGRRSRSPSGSRRCAASPTSCAARSSRSPT